MAESTTFMQDLIRGENDWINIQHVIRFTFKMLNDMTLKHQTEINQLQNEMRQIATAYSDLKTEVASKAGLSDLQYLEDKLSEKVDSNTFLAVLEKKEQMQESTDVLNRRLCTLERDMAKKVDHETFEQSMQSNVALIEKKIEQTKQGMEEYVREQSSEVKKCLNLHSQDFSKRITFVEENNAQMLIASKDVHTENQNRYEQVLQIIENKQSEMKDRIESIYQHEKETIDVLVQGHVTKVSKKLYSEYESFKRYLSSQIEIVSNLCGSKVDDERLKSFMKDQVSDLTHLMKKMCEDVSTKERSEQNKFILEKFKELCDQLDLKISRSDHDSMIHSIQESLKVCVLNQQKEKQEREGIVNKISCKIQDIDKAIEQLRSHINRKMDTTSVEDWMRHQILEFNAILDKKSSLDDLIKVRDALENKPDTELLREMVKQSFHKISEQIKMKVENLFSMIEEKYVEKHHLEEQVKILSSSINGRASIHEMKETKSRIDSLSRKISEKIDIVEYNREINRIENSKISRKELLSSSREIIETYIHEERKKFDLKNHFHCFTENLQNEIKKLISSKVDQKEYSQLLSKITTHYMSREELEMLVEMKMSSLKNSIESLSHNVSHCLRTRNADNCP